MKKIALLTLSALFVSATAAVAGDPHEGGFRRHKAPEKMMERHLEKLDLEPAQRERVQELLASGKEAREARRKEMREAFREMHELLEAETPDEDAIMRQAEKMGELKTEGHKAMLRTLLAVRAELTPEQREKLKEMRPRHRQGPWRDRDGGGDAAGE